MHRQGRVAVESHQVGEHRSLRLIEDLELAPSELRRLAIAADQPADEGQERPLVPPLRLHVHVLGPEPAAHHGGRKPRGAGVGEPSVAGVTPLHRRAHGVAPLGGELLAHADLLAVEEHGRAGEGEQEAVGHPDAARVAVEHRRQPSAEPAAVDLHVGLGTEGLEHLGALLVGELVERQLVVVPHEGRPLAGRRERRPRRERLGERARVGPGHRQVELLHPDEVEEHLQLVAVVTEELRLAGVGEVHLAEEHRIAGPARHERSELAEVLVRVGDVLTHGHAELLDEEGDGVHAEAGDPQLEPEPQHLLDLVADRGVGDVEVGLVAVEAMEVVGAGLLVVGPDALLLVGEHHVGGLRGRRVVGPHVPIAIRASPGSTERRGTTDGGRTCG